MVLDLIMKRGWWHWERDRNDSSYWSLARKDNVFNLKLPSEAVLQRLWRESTPNAAFRPLRVLARLDWGCIAATPKYIPTSVRVRFLAKVAKNRATRES
ncbi:MAG: hypothetical protein JWM39_525 [Parcubacteria group bacterium]|nr:hypothetical protein [Parcubacteria group bacterium]